MNKLLDFWLMSYGNRDMSYENWWTKHSLNYFTKKFTNYLYDEWLLVNEKVMLVVDLNEN